MPHSIKNVDFKFCEMHSDLKQVGGGGGGGEDADEKMSQRDYGIPYQIFPTLPKG